VANLLNLETLQEVGDSAKGSPGGQPSQPGDAPGGGRLFIRVADPYSFHLDNPDPDPIRIRIQSGSRVMTKNLKKITAEKKIKFFLIKIKKNFLIKMKKKLYIFFIKNCNLPIPRPP
jgi:hypothetical protein